MAANNRRDWIRLICVLLSSLSIETLNLENNAFFGGIPSELFILPLLRIINISRNFLTDPLPVELELAAFLEVLNLQTNFLPSIPTEIGGLISLRELRMGDNDALLGTIPTQIGLMQSLEILDLSGVSFLTGTIPTELGLVQTLQSANFGFSSLTGAMPAEVCAVAADPLLVLDTLIVDCLLPEVVCEVPTCCSACAE